MDARNEAIVKHGPPEIMKTDQGSQFTGSAWITTLTNAGVRISMEGRGRYLDNIFIERLRRSLKQAAVNLEEITDGFQARRVVKDWMAFYSTERPPFGARSAYAGRGILEWLGKPESSMKPKPDTP